MVKSFNAGHIRDQYDAASRQHFSLFLRRVMASVSPGVHYVHNWHIDAIAEYLAACARGDITRLIINLPPRMLKSTLVSVAWPAWLMGHEPTQRVMVACYAQALSLKHSTDCRAVMAARWYGDLFTDTRLAPDQNEKEKFATTRRGYRRAVSVGGAAIGEGGNILIIDDPLNPLQAGYRHQREAVNAWFDHTWATRLDDKARGCMLVVMQRLHAEDLSGYLLARGGWEHLCLPTIAPGEQRIIVGGYSHLRGAGEALHPARESIDLLERLKRDIGSANFAAQYQQAPRTQVGAVVKPEWFARFEMQTPGWEEVAAERIVQSWDTGIKAGNRHDASACATFVVRQGVHHLLDMTVVRMEYPALKRLIISHASRFSPEAVLIEDKGNGQSLLQDIRQETDLPLIGCVPSVDKFTRLMRVTPLMEAGKIALPRFSPWLATLEEELFSFPDSPHDDQVDAIVQYLNWIGRRARDMRVRRV